MTTLVPRTHIINPGPYYLQLHLLRGEVPWPYTRKAHVLSNLTHTEVVLENFDVNTVTCWIL